MILSNNTLKIYSRLFKFFKLKIYNSRKNNESENELKKFN